MYDHDYYAKMDKAMVRVLKAVARSVGYGFTGLYHYLKKQPARLYEYIRYQIQLERDDQREAERTNLKGESCREIYGSFFYVSGRYEHET